MEDRKNFAKLNDEQLEQVSGGFEQIDEDTWHFDEGDTFELDEFTYYVLETITTKKQNSIQVEKRYSTDEGPVSQTVFFPARLLLEGTYMGNTKNRLL